MKGEVEKIWNNETSDGRKYQVFQINGERYSLWDDNYIDCIQEGQSLEFDFKESGEFKNVTKIYGQEDQAREPTQTNDRLNKIVKMSSLRSASRILTGSEILYDSRADKTIEVAKKFEKYIDDEEVDAPED